MRSVCSKLEAWAAGAAHALFAVVVFSLLLTSGLFTCRLIRGETTLYIHDSILLNLLAVALALAVSTLALRLWRRTADRHKPFDHRRFQCLCLLAVLALVSVYRSLVRLEEEAGLPQQWRLTLATEE